MTLKRVAASIAAVIFLALVSLGERPHEDNPTTTTTTTEVLHAR